MRQESEIEAASTVLKILSNVKLVGLARQHTPYDHRVTSKMSNVIICIVHIIIIMNMTVQLCIGVTLKSFVPLKILKSMLISAVHFGFFIECSLL